MRVSGWAALATLIAALYGFRCVSAAKILEKPANPRGWQARASPGPSEELLAKLLTRPSPVQANPPKLHERDIRKPAQQRPSTPSGEDEVSGGERGEGNAPQQTSLSLLAVAIVSGLLGWALRGGAERLVERRRARSAQPVQEKAHLSPAGSSCGDPSSSGPEDSAAQSTGSEDAPADENAEDQAETDHRAPSRDRTKTGSEQASAGPKNRRVRRKGRQRRREAEKQDADATETKQDVPRRTHLPSTVQEPTTPGSGATANPRNWATPDAHSSGHAKPQTSPGWLRRAGSEALTPEGLGREASTAVVNATEAVDDISVLMETLADRLCLDVDAMNPQERMQLLQMSLQCCQHRESNWLHAQANDIRLSQAAAAHGTLQHKRERAQAADALRLLDAFRTSLEDGLLAGLALMLTALLWSGIRCGFLATRLGRCRELSDLPSVSWMRPWAALELASVLGCWLQAASDALLACCLMLGTAFLVLRGGMLRSSTHQAPQLKLMLGLGVVCGIAGYSAVGRLGGNAAKWLALWEGWVGLHMTAAWQLPALHKILTRGGRRGGLRMVIYQASLSIALPLSMGVLPFERCWAKLYTTLSGVLGA